MMGLIEFCCCLSSDFLLMILSSTLGLFLIIYSPPRTVVLPMGYLRLSLILDEISHGEGGRSTVSFFCLAAAGLFELFAAWM